MTLDLTTVRHHHAAILFCRGSLVLERGASLLREAGRRELAAGRSLALDLAFVTRMDARGTGVLAELYGEARQGGKRVVLLGASERVAHLVHLTRLDRFIHEFASSPLSDGEDIAAVKRRRRSRDTRAADDADRQQGDLLRP